MSQTDPQGSCLFLYKKAHMGLAKEDEVTAVCADVHPIFLVEYVFSDYFTLNAE